MRIRRFFQLALVANFLLSLYFFFQQGLNSGVSLPHFDKVGHFIAFFVLALCVDFASHLKRLVAVFLLIAYGIGVEFIQSHIPGREASFGDILADAAGVVFYYYFVANIVLVKRYKVASGG